MKIKNIHGGSIYVKLAEKHGRSILPDETVSWPDTDANYKEAKLLQDKRLIQIVSDSPAKGAPVKAASLRVSPSAGLPPEVAAAMKNRMENKPAVPQSSETVTQPEIPAPVVVPPLPATPAPHNPLADLPWAGVGVSVGPHGRPAKSPPVE